TPDAIVNAPDVPIAVCDGSCALTRTWALTPPGARPLSAGVHSQLVAEPGTFAHVAIGWNEPAPVDSSTSKDVGNPEACHRMVNGTPTNAFAPARGVSSDTASGAGVTSIVTVAVAGPYDGSSAVNVTVST